VRNRYERQSFLGPKSEATLRSLCVAIVGLGGGGSHIAQQLGHIGVGRFLLFDPQRIDDTNLNRLVGATEGDVARRAYKTAITRRLITRVNSAAKVEQFRDDWKTHALRLRGCDIVIGCVDTYRDRSELEIQARRYHIPYLDIGMDVNALPSYGHLIGGQVILSMPGGPCMRCMGFLQESLLAQEAARYGDVGSRPQVIWSNGLLASTAVGALIQLFTPWHAAVGAQVYMEYDGNTQQLQPSERLKYLPERCMHFDAEDVGDPWYNLD